MKKKLAFTFIEVMIAIVIFSVGILTVLKLVTNNLKMMDENNIKIQATLLAKEGLDLIYDLRDSNLKRELSWNCLMNKDMYMWTQYELNKAIGRGDHQNFEDIICDGYFGVDNDLQLGFDIKNYMYYNLSYQANDFDDRFQKNRLYLYTGVVNYYGYNNGSKYNNIIDTPFARYLSFANVVEGDAILPSDKILKVESHVLYKKGGMTGEIVFESFIGAY